MWYFLCLGLFNIQSTNRNDHKRGVPLFGPSEAAGYGTDGNTSTCFHTTCRDLEWWMVDLQGLYPIKEITIMNVKNWFHKERLKNFRIDVFKKDPRHDDTFVRTVGEICVTQGDSTIIERLITFTCSPGIVGRYVRFIWQSGYSECLHFCEFEVLVDNVYSRSIRYEMFEDERTTDSPLLSLTTDDFWTCVTACNNRRDTELCTAFNWAPELNQCLLLSVQPYTPVNLTPDHVWSLYRATAY